MTAEKPKILVVDHDARDGADASGSSRTREYLGRLTDPQYNCLTERYDVATAPSCPAEMHEFGAYVDGILALYPSVPPEVILVDLNLAHRTPYDRQGLVLASLLAERFPKSAVLVYTMGTPQGPDMAECSVAGVDGILPRMCDETLKSEWALRLPDILKKARENRGTQLRRALGVALGVGGALPKIEWVDAVLRETPMVAQAIRVLAWELFSQMPEPVSKVELSLLSGGFSGDYLVKCRTYDEDGCPFSKQWVLKVSEHAPSRLQQELEGYAILRQYLHRSFHPDLHPETTNHILRIAPDWFGALAVSYEDGWGPLVERFADIDAASVYRHVFQNCLFKVYGDSPARITDPIELPRPASVCRAREYVKSIAGWSTVASAHLPGYDRLCQGLGSFLASADVGGVTGPILGCKARRVHGDLNSRNILVAPTGRRPSFCLVDFPGVGATRDSMPLAIDFAKAEAELLFVVLDRDNGQDIDPARLGVWSDLASCLASRLRFVPGDLEGCDIDANLLKSISALRSLYIEKAAGEDNDCQRQYSAALLDYALRYLGYKDITPAKKCLAVVLAGKVIDCLSQSSVSPG